MKRYALFFILIFALWGCRYTPRYAFREAGTYSDDPATYQKNIEEKHLEAKIKYRKAKKVKSDGLITWVIQFDMQFNNTGPYSLTLTPGDYVLLDDEGHRIEPDFDKLDSNMQNFHLWPKSSLKLAVSYEFPPEYDLTKTGSLRLLWQYREKSNLYRRVTKFLKHEVQYRYREVSPDRWYYNCSPWGCSHGINCRWNYRHRW